jgi:hypothetical protein
MALRHAQRTGTGRLIADHTLTVTFTPQPRAGDICSESLFCDGREVAAANARS